ncbi:hypothetical protein IGW14_23040 [Streptomyces hygroscopicus subsp. hygroscopicus]|uniref:Uncharacterized protein n=1 Tax=Streptomyces demainii TaxID=588122 RepID=A0ABT9KWB0_9ACTN|nr:MULTISPECIES: hypothetical protein [Streptomyces]MBW8090811.1 hypothetical protein [Streptomyces hygroscopicus subsp. hygroscopicus]MDP9612737.1 hypothetical protein [Streptomyces demainii]
MKVSRVCVLAVAAAGFLLARYEPHAALPRGPAAGASAAQADPAGQQSLRSAGGLDQQDTAERGR